MTGQAARAPGGDGRYFQAVEEHFVRLRGAPVILSPDDWHLVASWRERRIPLGVALRGITQVFQQAASRGGHRGPIQSLAYCRHAVEEEFARHLAAAVGASAGAGAGPTPAARLRSLAGRLAVTLEAWPAGAHATAHRIRGGIQDLARDLDGGLPLEEAEARLASMEDTLLASLEAALPGAQRHALRRAGEERLAEHRPRMTLEVYQRTCQRALRGEIRRLLQVPRLSLLAD